MAGPVFISHASEDNDITKRIYDALISDGIDAWVDFEKLNAGDQWDVKVQEALNAASAGLVVLSKASLASEQCRGEWQTLITLDRPLFVALIEPLSDAEFPFSLRTFQYVNLTSDFDPRLRRIIDAIKSQGRPDKTPEPQEGQPLPPLPKPPPDRRGALAGVLIAAIVIVALMISRVIMRDLTPTATPTLPPTATVTASPSPTATPTVTPTATPAYVLPSGDLRVVPARPLLVSILIATFDKCDGDPADALRQALTSLAIGNDLRFLRHAPPLREADVEAFANRGYLVMWGSCDAPRRLLTVNFRLPTERRTPPEVFELASVATTQPASQPVAAGEDSPVFVAGRALVEYLHRSFDSAAASFDRAAQLASNLESQVGLRLMQGNSLLFVAVTQSTPDYEPVLGAYRDALEVDTAWRWGAANNYAVALLNQGFETRDFSPELNVILTPWVEAGIPLAAINQAAIAFVEAALAYDAYPILSEYLNNARQLCTQALREAQRTNERELADLARACLVRADLTHYDTTLLFPTLTAEVTKRAVAPDALVLPDAWTYWRLPDLLRARAHYHHWCNTQRPADAAEALRQLDAYFRGAHPDRRGTVEVFLKPTWALHLEAAYYLDFVRQGACPSN
jgi:hypothetical protein